MKKLIIPLVVALAATTVAAQIASTNDPMAGVQVPVAAATPESTLSYLIAIIAPLFVAWVYKVMPNIPKVLIPCLGPVVGLVLGIGMNILGKAHLSAEEMAKAGMMAVFVREVFNQAIRTEMAQSAIQKIKGTGQPDADTPDK